MDPLGAPSHFVDVDVLPSWNDVYYEECPESYTTGGEDIVDGVRRSPFPCRIDINSKVILWRGDVALLGCTAIVNTSNETLTDKNPVSDSIYNYAGSELLEELQKLKGH